MSDSSNDPNPARTIRAKQKLDRLAARDGQVEHLCRPEPATVLEWVGIMTLVLRRQTRHLSRAMDMALGREAKTRCRGSSQKALEAKNTGHGRKLDRPYLDY